jgi:hypothetical protein
VLWDVIVIGKGHDGLQLLMQASQTINHKRAFENVSSNDSLKIDQPFDGRGAQAALIKTRTGWETAFLGQT